MNSPGARLVVAGALTLFVVLGVTLTERALGTALPVGVGVIAIGAALAWRSVAGWPLAVAMALAAGGIAYLGNQQSSNLAWFGLCVIAGGIALSAPPVHAAIFGVGLVAIPVVQWLRQSEEPGWAAWIAGIVFTLVSCMFARRQRILLDELRAAQGRLAERTRSEERNRIAAEMHDVIGHALTVSLLHIGSARLSLDEDPEEARASLAEAERLAQQSLAEVRASVGLMRSAGASVAPLPGVADVPELVESFRRAGTPVALDVAGELAAVPATRGLAIYRIVQESLTNVARHAPGQAAEVRIQVAGDATTVTVTSGGAPAPSAREGAGVLGMRERAEALGGRLLAGPSQGGWRVEAVLPS
jgi:signal transduction histidine kinase